MRRYWRRRGRLCLHQSPRREKCAWIRSLRLCSCFPTRRMMKKSSLNWGDLRKKKRKRLEKRLKRQKTSTSF
nr:hypothetical protein Iba_chr13cCG12490 [Ipomoea batatas]